MSYWIEGSPKTTGFYWVKKLDGIAEVWCLENEDDVRESSKLITHFYGPIFPPCDMKESVVACLREASKTDTVEILNQCMEKLSLLNERVTKMGGQMRELEDEVQRLVAPMPAKKQWGD